MTLPSLTANEISEYFGIEKTEVIKAMRLKQLKKMHLQYSIGEIIEESKKIEDNGIITGKIKVKKEKIKECNFINKKDLINMLEPYKNKHAVFIRPREVSNILGVSRSTIYRWHTMGFLAGVRFNNNKSLRIYIESLENFLKNSI